MLPQEELVELRVELRVVRVAGDELARPGHGGVEVVRDDEQLGDDLADRGVVRAEPRRRLERLVGVLGVVEAIAVDEPELMEERELEVRVRLGVVLGARDHLPVRALEALPVLRLGERADELLERVEPLLVDVEHLIEEVGGADRVADLLENHLRHREEALGLLLGALVDLRDALEHVRQVVPAVPLAVEPEQRVEEPVVERLDEPRLLEDRRRLVELVGTLAPRSRPHRRAAGSATSAVVALRAMSTFSLQQRAKSPCAR